MDIRMMTLILDFDLGYDDDDDDGNDDSVLLFVII